MPRYETYVPELDGDEQVWLQDDSSNSFEQAALHSFDDEDNDFSYTVFVREVGKSETIRKVHVDRATTVTVEPVS